MALETETPAPDDALVAGAGLCATVRDRGGRLPSAEVRSIASIAMKTCLVLAVVTSAGRRTGHAYYVKEGTVYAADPATRTSRAIAKVPAHGSLEPNVTFTPDGRWVVFRSNMLGPTHVFAVEVKETRK